MNDARVTITVGGYFDSLPGATKDYVMRMVNKGAAKYGWNISFADQRGSADFSEFASL